VRYGTGLGVWLREMAILLVAARRDSFFEQHAHESVGRAVGLTHPERATIRRGGLPDVTDAVERAGVVLTHALLDGDVDDPTWQQCVPPLDAEAVFELTTLVGYYSILALQMRVFRVDR
jgi:4-carboxymuconolactone decarboxylase